MTRDAKLDELCGILNVDKPLRLTSHDIVRAVRGLSGQRKVGHAGTLDPLATGVLLVCLGQATRVTEYLMASRKTYRAAIHLGVSTTTDDREGEITREAVVDVTRQGVEAILPRFVGRIAQVPPVYSAIKRGGTPLYKLARRGIAVDPPPRQVKVHTLRILEWAPPVVRVEVQCGPGTYIRALARDLGEALGCGAHLCALRRTQSGQFTVEQAVTLEGLEGAFAEGAQRALLHPLDAALHHLPALHLGIEASRRLAMGQQVQSPGGFAETGEARVVAPTGRCIALAYRDEQSGAWRPRKVFVRPEDLSLG